MRSGSPAEVGDAAQRGQHGGDGRAFLGRQFGQDRSEPGGPVGAARRDHRGAGRGDMHEHRTTVPGIWAASDQPVAFQPGHQLRDGRLGDLLGRSQLAQPQRATPRQRVQDRQRGETQPLGRRQPDEETIELLQRRYHLARLLLGHQLLGHHPLTVSKLFNLLI